MRISIDFQSVIINSSLMLIVKPMIVEMRRIKKCQTLLELSGCKTYTAKFILLSAISAAFMQ